MRTAYITIFGLNTPADSDCYGLRVLMQSFVVAGDTALFFAYDDPQLLPAVKAAVAGFDQVILCGHSHGGAAVKWILDHWAAAAPAVAPCADLAIFLDPAPEAFHFSQFFSWQAADTNLFDRWHVPLSVCARAVCIYQRNEMIVPGLIGVCGVPFVPVPLIADLMVSLGVGQSTSPVLDPSARVQNVNVTGWGLYHCHMLSDDRVQQLVSEAVSAGGAQAGDAPVDSVGNGVAGRMPNSTRGETEQLRWLQIFLASLDRRINNMPTKQDLQDALTAAVTRGAARTAELGTLRTNAVVDQATIADLRTQLASAQSATDVIDQSVIDEINQLDAPTPPPSDTPVAPTT